MSIRTLSGACLALANLLGPLAAGCSTATGDGSSIPDAGAAIDGGASDAPAPVPESGAGDDGSSDEAAPAPQAFLRVLHASPDAPALDVCVAPHGTSVFQGPLIGQLAAALATAAGDDGGDAGALPGITYSQVSAYVSLDAGSYDLRIVPAGATTCSVETDAAPDAATDADAGPVTDAGPLTGSPPDAGPADGVAIAQSTVTLSAGTFTTVLVAGDLVPAGSDAPAAVTAMTDDAVLPGGAALLRVVNAVPSAPHLDFGLGSASAWLPLFTDVIFGSPATIVAPGEDTLDSNGYMPIGGLVSQPMSARATGADAAADLAAAAAIAIDVGSVATVLAIGGKTGDTGHPPSLLVCIDNQPSGGLLSDCSVAP